MPFGELIKKRLHLGVNTATSSNTGQQKPDVPDLASSSSPASQQQQQQSHHQQQRKRSAPLKELEESYKEQLSSLDEDDDVFVSPHSSLMLTIDDVLGKSKRSGGSSGTPVAYFLHYLELRDASNLLKFWIDVEGFKSSLSSPSGPSNTSCGVLDSRDFDASFPSLFSSTCSNPQSPLPPEEEEDGHRQSKSTESFDSGFADKFSSNHVFPGSAAEKAPAPNAAAPTSPQDNSSWAVSNGTRGADDCASESSSRRSPLSRDAVQIYQRYIAPDCPSPISLSRDVTHSIVQGICTESGDLDATCFDLAQAQVVKTLEAEFFPDFLRSEGNARHQLDVLASGDVQMSDILHNDALLFHFMEFLEGEGDRDLIEFWMAASNFRQNDGDKEFRQSDALAIYDKFVSMQATSPLGVSDGLRSRLEESICSESGTSQHCFDPLQSLVVRLLQVKHLNAFLGSSLFRHYLSELLGQVQQQHNSPFAPSAASTARKKSGMLRRSGSNTSLSTCSSSDFSISTQNTLLAMSRSRSDYKVGNNNRSSMLSLDYLDPDSIWKRRKGHVMVNIGRVDAMGRYRSSLEHLPPNPGEVTVGSKFSRVMKRLVSNDIGQVQEELAWQMAEMVVNDVLEITSASPPPAEKRLSTSS